MWLSKLVNGEDDEEWEKVLDDDKSTVGDPSGGWTWVEHDESGLSTWEVFNSEVL